MVLGSLAGTTGQVRADLTITGSFTGMSDEGAYPADPNTPGNWLPLPPSPFTASFTYTDDGTRTTLTIEITGPAILGPDMVAEPSISEPDIGIAQYPSLIFPRIFYVDQQQNVHIDFETPDITGGYGDPKSLVGVGHLRADNTVDPATFVGRAFNGGEYGFIGGPGPLGAPEPSNLIFGAIAGLMGIGYAWRRRKAMRVA